MNQEQQYEIQKAQKCLKEAREHLDNAMYRLGNLSDENYNKCRSMYNLICEANDKF